MGEGPRGNSGARSTLHLILVTCCATHNQIGPLCCWFPSGWACACFRPLWVSPTISPVRLGVCPAATPTPMGVFSQRFGALFPRAGALGYGVCFAPRCLSGLSMRECGAVRFATRCSACPILHHSESGPLSLSVRKCGAAGSASGQTAALFVPRSASLGPSKATRVLSPLAAVSAPPTGLDECLFFLSPWCRTSLPLDSLSVLVVGGGTVCLPTPPSWFSDDIFLKDALKTAEWYLKVLLTSALQNVVTSLFELFLEDWTQEPINTTKFKNREFSVKPYTHK